MTEETVKISEKGLIKALVIALLLKRRVSCRMTIKISC